MIWLYITLLATVGDLEFNLRSFQSKTLKLIYVLVNQAAL